MRRRRNTNSQLPSGPMLRTLRRIAKGKGVAVVTPSGPVRGFALVVAGLTSRGLIEPGEAVGEERYYRLTPAGQLALQQARTVRS